MIANNPAKEYRRGPSARCNREPPCYTEAGGLNGGEFRRAHASGTSRTTSLVERVELPAPTVRFERGDCRGVGESDVAEGQHRAEGELATASSLLWRAKSRDPLAWERLVRLYGPTVFTWCRRAGLQDSDASDVGQEVFQAVARNIGKFQRARGEGSFRSWLRKIAHTKVMDFFRRVRREGRAPGGTDFQAVVQEIADPSGARSPADDEQEKTSLLRRAMELLQEEFEPTTWKAFWWTTVDGRSAQDVAAELQTTANAVYISRSRVLKRLREEFVEVLDW